MYKRVITHNDFDGIVSASLCAYHYKVNNLYFSSPNNVIDKTITISDSDILCDLPYSGGCGLWFDHHIGNTQELSQRSIDVNTIDGKFALEPSCARVLFNHINSISKLPDYFEDTIKHADIIDSFDYPTVNHWQEKTPGKIINSALFSHFASPLEERQFMEKLVFALRDHHIDDVSKLDWITSRAQQYFSQEESMIATIKDCVYFCPQDTNKEIAVIDLTKYNKKPYIVKTLVFLVEPSAKAVIVLQNQFNKGIKLNNMFISMSLGFYFHNKNHGKDIGSIMDELGLGDGHKGAAGGRIWCESKQEMMKSKVKVLSQIFKLWNSQPEEIKNTENCN